MNIKGTITNIEYYTEEPKMNRLTKIENLLIDLKNDPDNLVIFCDTVVEVAKLYSDYKSQEDRIDDLNKRIDKMEDTFVLPNQRRNR